jgi:hypothetical protein
MSQSCAAILGALCAAVVWTLASVFWIINLSFKSQGKGTAAISLHFFEAAAGQHWAKVSRNGMRIPSPE